MCSESCLQTESRRNQTNYGAKQQEVKKKILRRIPWFKFPKVTTIARLLCTQELRAIQGSPFLPVNDPCDDGSTRATNPNEGLNMSKNVREFRTKLQYILEDSV